MKKYDFSMKSMTFFTLPPSFLQDFCKKAQWRAKKLRERGSNTARPTEKGVGGLPIRSRFGRFRRDLACRSRRFRRDSVGFVVIWRADSVGFVAICGLPLGVSCRFGRVDAEDKTQKSPIHYVGGSGSTIARRRALNLRLIPLSNTRASARGVRLGRARQWCIVRLASDRRRIGHYI